MPKLIVRIQTHNKFAKIAVVINREQALLANVEITAAVMTISNENKIPCELFLYRFYCSRIMNLPQPVHAPFTVRSFQIRRRLCAFLQSF